jgi:hypothetical protein
MNGREQLATNNGGGNPRWNSFVTAGASVFPTFFEEPKLDTIQNFLRGGNRILTTQQKEEVRQKLVVTNRLVFVREQVSIQDLKGVFADDIEIVDITTMQECGPADCYFGYFNGEQGDSVLVGLQVTRANSQSDEVFKLCTVHKSKNFIIRQDRRPR